MNAINAKTVAENKKKENIMRRPKIGKILLSAGATGTDLDKSKKLLETFSSMKVEIIKSGPKRRIPSFGVKPNMPLGARVTLRGDNAIKILRRLLGAVDNALKESQVADNGFSFGIKEYIEIPDMEYIRGVGIRGFNVTVVFERKGLRIKNKKIKGSRLPKKQRVSKQEIIRFMEENFKTKFVK